MSCFKIPGLPKFNLDISIPDIDIPDPFPINIGLPFPGISFPTWLLNFHPNLCDLIMLFFLLFLLLTGKGPGEMNPSLEEAVEFIQNLTSASDFFGQNEDRLSEVTTARTDITFKSLDILIRPIDTDKILESIDRNFDVDSMSIYEISSVLELHGLDDTYIDEFYDLRKTGKGILTRF